MELDERKEKILFAIIRNYLETGEPVGSRTISKYTDLNLSSATIRNEMSDLEELGLIIQPHTSAGRIPSDQGYRYYVDRMMERERELQDKEQELKSKEDLLIEKADQLEDLLQTVARTLADSTNYTAMVSSPQYKNNRLKFIQLTGVDERTLLCVIVTENNAIKNRVIQIPEPIDQETILKLNLLLNTTLAGLAVEEITLATITNMAEQAGKQREVVRTIVEAVGEAILSTDDEMRIYTSGATNIFRYPELSDQDRARELIDTLEQKKLLTTLVSDGSDGDENGTGIQVYIGNETPIQSMKDCSVVTATYELDDGVTGTIGIIGPKRMDYRKAIESLRTVKSQLDEAFRKT
ncbi:MAG: heat-inducible transcriptional repressor HrcA [Lachnospiraceae bacterium]|nr:heat-inducible transcriptional repressor HrcA [Lachnospiraceae bacterium]